MTTRWPRAWLVAGLFGWAGAAAAVEGSRTVVSTTVLDLSEADADPSPASLSFPFHARSDQSLSGAELRLTFAGVPPPGIHGLEVQANGERVGFLSAAQLADTVTLHSVPIPSERLGDQNYLALHVVIDASGACARVASGTWRLIKKAELITESSPLPLPNDLALLPLPFVDRGHDTAGVVPMVFAGPPTSERVRIAGLIAGWLGMDVGLPMRFPVSVGQLPETSAIVFVESTAEAQRLGLPVPSGASARMLDHPRFPNSNVKLLVLGGRTSDELATVVENIATGTAPLAGPQVHFTERPAVSSSLPDGAPRWLPAGFIPFDRYPAKTSLTHAGTTPGIIPVKFRIAPDLWTWPAEYVRLELSYTVATSPGIPAPELDVEVNGTFVGKLPSLQSGARTLTRRTTVPIRSEILRGFNELRVHVRYPGLDGCGVSSVDDASVTLGPGSGFHLEGFGHFASLPDVSLFVHDGFPFTRLADLSETAVVLPDAPDPAEISTALSALAHFASVTGVAGTRVTVLTAQEFLAHAELDKDLLLVGLPSDHVLLHRWIEHMSLVPGPAGVVVQMPSENSDVLRVLSGRLGRSEMRRASDVASGVRSVAAVMGWESPVRPGRSVVAVTATSTQDLPAMADVSGFADARSRAGDLLIASGAKRWMFRIGPSYGSGELQSWTKARWLIANHWLSLFPALFAAAFVLGARVRKGLDGRIRTRLS